MATTDIQDRKLELIQWLSVVEDVSIIDQLSEIKEQSSSDWWDEIADAERVSISKGLDDAQAGRLKPHIEAKAIYEKRL
jgi:hypothetical protein